MAKKSVAEFLNDLNQDPHYQELMRERKDRRMKTEKMLNEDENPIVLDLKSTGLEVSSVWDLVNEKSSYAKAIPVLLSHLKRDYHPKTKEGIIRALTTREARGIATEEIIEQYDRAPEDTLTNLKWVLANCLTEIADMRSLPKIRELASNNSHLTGKKELQGIIEKYDKASSSIKTRSP